MTLLCMKWHAAWLYGVHRTRRDGSSFTWHQPCQHCKHTTSVNIQKTRCKKLVIHVESITCEHGESDRDQKIAPYKSDKQTTVYQHSSGAVWESRWTSWAVRPNEPSGFRGRKELLNRASALVTTCQLTSEDIKHQFITVYQPVRPSGKALGW